MFLLGGQADEMPAARRKVRPAGAGAAAARRAALRWWLLSLAAAGATVTAAAALLAVALHVSGLAAHSASSGAPYRLSQPREVEELRWEQEFAPPQLASPRKVVDSPANAVSLLVAAAVAFFCFFPLIHSPEPMTPGLISRFDSWTARPTTRWGRGCGCRRRRRRGVSFPAWRRRRSTEVRALLAHFAPTSISRLVIQIAARSSDFVRPLQARWCREGTCSYTPMAGSTRCALG